MAPRKSVKVDSAPTTSPLVQSTVVEVEESVTLSETFSNLWNSYLTKTSKQLKLVDGLQFFLMLTGIAQFAYCVLVTNYPFNAFLGGFSATVGQFVLSASLRSQVNPENKKLFSNLSPERAFADFLFGSLVLHFFVFNYLG